MSYKVTITNNENGKVLVDEEKAVAIVGAIGNEQGTRSIVFTACDAISLGDAISAAEDVISQLKKMTKQEQIEEVRKETAIDFYSEMYDFAYRTKSYYTDALNNIIAKIDETFNDFRIELESLLRKYGVEVEE